MEFDIFFWIGVNEYYIYGMKGVNDGYEIY